MVFRNPVKVPSVGLSISQDHIETNRPKSSMFFPIKLMRNASDVFRKTVAILKNYFNYLCLPKFWF